MGYKIIASIMVLSLFVVPIYGEYRSSGIAEDEVRLACERINNIAEFKDYKGAAHGEIGAIYRHRAERQRYEVFSSTAYRTHYCTMIADAAGVMIKKTLTSSWR